MRTVDGSQGEGGGQVLRTTLALSLLTGEPVTLVHIRAGRARPGLMRQHLAAVQLASRVGDAEVEGAAPGSQRLVFRPRGVTPGDYEMSVGTAGSATLVLQTVLPALLVARGPTTLVLEGGTHNPLAPPFDFLAESFLPLVNRMGPRVEARLERWGFYPAGGGRMVVRVRPAERVAPLELLDGGPVRRVGARAVVAGLSADIARRELAVLERRLGWTSDTLHVEQRPASEGPGNVLLATIQREQVTEVATGFGEKGRSAEAVAEEVASEVSAYLEAGVPVGAHLADQLLIPMAMAGAGAFRTLPLSLHARTQVQLLEQLTGARFTVRQLAGRTEVSVAARA